MRELVHQHLFDPPKGTKVCRKCGADTNDFAKDRRRPDGRQDWCRKCQSDYGKTHRAEINKVRAAWRKDPRVKAQEREYYRKNRPRLLYIALRQRAAKRNIPFELTYKEFGEIRAAQHCPICSVQFHELRTVDMANRVHPAARTIDRFDSSGPYSRANCTCLCARCNALKGEGTAEEHDRIAAWMRARSKGHA